MNARPKRRPAFAADALSDIDDILPPVSVPPAPVRGAPDDSAPDPTPVETAAAPPAPRLVSPTVPGTDEADPPITDRADGSRRRSRRRARGQERQPTTRLARFVPEVAIATDVADSLRALTLRERSVSAVAARTYGQVVLDAVEAHAEQLSTHWSSESTPASGGLFSRNVAPQRRRHQAPPARVALAGISIEDTQQLDHLVERWKAGNRSALVEQALRLYLPE